MLILVIKMGLSSLYAVKEILQYNYFLHILFHDVFCLYGAKNKRLYFQNEGRAQETLQMKSMFKTHGKTLLFLRGSQKYKVIHFTFVLTVGYYCNSGLEKVSLLLLTSAIIY